MTNDNKSENYFSDDPKLTAYVLGELSVEEAAEMERAIDGSPELAAAVAQIRATVGNLEDMFAGEPKLSLSESAKLELKTNAFQQHKPRDSVASKRPWGRWLLAACIGTILLGGVAGVMLPPVQQVREAARRVATEDIFLEPATGNMSLQDGVQSDEKGYYEYVEPGSAPPTSNPSARQTDDTRNGIIGQFTGDAPAVNRDFAEYDPGVVAFRTGTDVLDLAEDNKELQSDLMPRSGRVAGVGGESDRWDELGEASGGDEGRRLAENTVMENENLSRLFLGGKAESALSVLDASETGRKLVERLNEPPAVPAAIMFNGQQASKSNATPKKSKTPADKGNARTWKRVRAIPNTTRLMVGDKDELDLTGMQVNVQVDGFRARVLIDYLYYNDRDQQLEGNFKLRLPEDSSLYYFAFGESANELDDQRQLARSEFIDNAQLVSFSPATIAKTRTDVWRNVKEARMVPREKAAYAFRETVRRRVDPALVEWSGAGVFNAKVFPLAPKKVHRIVVGYDVNLTQTGDQLSYRLDLPQSSGDCQVEINAQDLQGVTYDIQPATVPVEVDFNDQLYQRFYYDGRPEETIQLIATLENETPLLLKSNQSGQDFWAAQIKPDLPVEAATGGSTRAMFLLDTSLSSSPDKLNVWLKLLEATLANNRDSIKEFGVLFFSVDQHFWQSEYQSNSDQSFQQLKSKLDEVVLEGATDLFAALQTITDADWVHAEGAPDLFLLSDGAANWGETNLRQMGQLLASPESKKTTGSLFAYQTGLTGTAVANLRYLSGQTGGAVFSVTTEAEIDTASTAHRQRPWRLKSITADGATDFLTAGRVQWVYPGQSITIAGRGNVNGEIALEVSQGETSKTYSTSLTPVESELAPRLYGQISVGQLEAMGDAALDVSAAYARHFRVTGQTCSLLMLESEADYQRFDIKPEEDEFVIKSKLASKLIDDLEKRSAQQLSDPKAQLVSWLKRLETMQGVNFKMSTALKLALDDIMIATVFRPLDCQWPNRDDLSKGYLTAIEKENLEYDVIAGQAKKRGRDSIDDSIKVFSSLIERSPGDVTIARDVAFTAMELDRPAQAYYLLRAVAQARPFQGSVYPAIGKCLAQLGQPDMAVVYYEVALGGQFQRQGNHFRQIVAVDYLHLLRQIVAGDVKSSVKEFAAARLETLSSELPFRTADVLVTMLWNQDQTDVDLHVTEPSGEKCFYSHNKTNSGGEITSDITTGFGPEMYFNSAAPVGEYKVAVKFYGSQQNRTRLKNKVYLQVIKGFGTPKETRVQKTLQLKNAGDFQEVMTIER